MIRQLTEPSNYESMISLKTLARSIGTVSEGEGYKETIRITESKCSNGEAMSCSGAM